MLTETEITKLDHYFDIRPMNEWMRAAKGKPVPRHLFGELWREGEIAIMFADTGKAKSVLAVQMAEAIARGRSVAPFESTAKPAKVLYLDFELTDKQIEMRYTADDDPERGGVLKRPYLFSQKFCRIELRPDVLSEKEGQPIEEALRDLIQPLLIQTGAKILIVDNITYLKRTADSTREAVPLMKELQRLKKRFGLSILVIAHTPKRDARRPLAVNDLQGSKVIANYADNIFAIGQSRRCSTERYIKHIKPRSDEVIYDADHLPVFTLKKLNGNFLGFEHTGFASEAELLSTPAYAADPDLVNLIKELHDAGTPIRRIAERFGLSKSTAHRYLQTWKRVEEDEDEEDSNYHDGHSMDCVTGCKIDHLRDKRLRKYGIFTAVMHAPKETEDDLNDEELETSESCENAVDPIGAQFDDNIVTDSPSESSVHPEVADSLNPEAVESGPLLGTTERKEYAENPLDQLKLVIDDYGKERFIESESEDGKPKVWYQYRSDGVLRRWEKTLNGVLGGAVEEKNLVSDSSIG